MYKLRFIFLGTHQNDKWMRFFHLIRWYFLDKINTTKTVEKPAPLNFEGYKTN